MIIVPVDEMLVNVVVPCENWYADMFERASGDPRTAITTNVAIQIAMRVYRVNSMPMVKTLRCLDAVSACIESAESDCARLSEPKQNLREVVEETLPPPIHF